MRRITREDYPVDTLQRIVGGVTFFKELIQHHPEQFELLMSVASFVTADENEVILHKATTPMCCIFCLKARWPFLPKATTARS